MNVQYLASDQIQFLNNYYLSVTVNVSTKNNKIN